jgi:predicted DNA-binding transcriptional regulator YafY
MRYTRVHRLFKLVTLIQSRAGWTTKLLSEECGVAERTIFRDLHELEGVGVPVKFDERTQGYRIDQGFFLPPVQLTADEALALALLCEHIAEPEQIAYLRPAWRALAKIEAQMPAAVREEIGSVIDAVAIQTAASMPADGYADVYERVKTAIGRRCALVCRYESLDGRSAAEEFDFEPYALFFGVRAWYAIGYHAGRDAVRSLKLNRFSKVAQTERPYTIPEGFTVEGHLGNAWRMIRGETEHQVELWFSAAFAQTVCETRWHRTQSVEFHADGSATFRCTVAGLDEIVWWVLSYGPHCRVNRPAELRSRVMELAAATVALYSAGEGEAGSGGDDRRPYVSPGDVVPG